MAHDSAQVVLARVQRSRSAVGTRRILWEGLRFVPSHGSCEPRAKPGRMKTVIDSRALRVPWSLMRRRTIPDDIVGTRDDEDAPGGQGGRGVVVVANLFRPL